MSCRGLRRGNTDCPFSEGDPRPAGRGQVSKEPRAVPSHPGGGHGPSNVSAQPPGPGIHLMVESQPSSVPQFPHLQSRRRGEVSGGTLGLPTLGAGRRVSSRLWVAPLSPELTAFIHNSQPTAAGIRRQQEGTGPAFPQGCLPPASVSPKLTVPMVIQSLCPV